MLLAYLLLGTALTISAVAIYYSVAGLAAIFAAAFWPIIVMGTTLEIAKLVAASWLKMYWEKIPRLLKWYLTASVVVLMLITSMGIFGFLSKAHLDNNLIGGDVVDKVAIIDEKIRTQRDNIEAARKALRQMDEAVDQTMARSTSEQGADKAAALRRQQQRERTNLQNDIARSQAAIAKLNEERAPIAKDLRKVEAEVGPIKYIAKLIYGDNPDQNILEKAVTWVIIMIIFVFDPLAVLMLLASQWTFAYLRQQQTPALPEPQNTSYVFGPWPFPTQDLEQKTESQDVAENATEETAEQTQTEEPIKCYKCGTDLMNAPGIGPFCPNKNCDVSDGPFVTEPVTISVAEPLQLNREILAQADQYDSDVTYDWDGGSKIYSKSYIQHLIKQLQEKKISVNNLNQEELNEITAELEAQQPVESNKDNNAA